MKLPESTKWVLHRATFLAQLESGNAATPVLDGTFATMGAVAFAERAAREPHATGETARKRTAETRGDLTAREAQIARLAADGLSNPEVGARLFISPRTVQYHLHKVFGKLGIASRGELRLVFADHDPARMFAVPGPGDGAY